MKKRKYYASYTVIFLTVSFGVYIWFLFGKRTFIWHADGWNEYYKALVYYAQYLRSILRGLLLNHTLEIPNWDFSLGEGSDILQTLQCFGIGDPIVALSVFVPADFLHLFYSISALFRLYLAGVAFSELCFKMDYNNHFAVLAGAIAYVFSHWGIYHVSIHPYFITPLICLPLLILGIEKIGVSQYLCWYCIITSPVGSCAHPLHCANSKFAQWNSRLQTVCPSCRLRNERRWKIMHYSD